ncbi:hypothetical protein T02_7406 [Trichinella nativa]|uniref:Uncharacterized protein n=1 Tax=Trichinella nativa TaxID=6335 RepID=A0A0V1LHE5_9BILA|nr:hypothetical protein T02_7406 [Trichinella nativa]
MCGYLNLLSLTSHFFRLSRETRNQKPPGYVCCTLLIFSDRLMPKKSIFGEKAFSRKLQNFMGFMALWTWHESQSNKLKVYENLQEINLTDDSQLSCTTVCFNVQGNNYNAVRQTVAVRNQGAIARCYIQVKI